GTKVGNQWRFDPAEVDRKLRGGSEPTPSKSDQ
ncbi:MAG: hypothetical protein QOH72_886, partial [Solirubrobacteraceae bacterium]|nr:hypothetical protein [Solirubrobacteraceae bacterium]